MKQNNPPRIFLSPPHMGGKELEYISSAIKDNWVAPLGENVDEFEKDLARFCGVKYAAALNSGTAAIHLSLILSDIQPGDFVICPSLTFSATVNPVRYLNAIPILIDSESSTWNIDPILVEKAIKDHTSKSGKIKAILPVHLYGMPSQLDAIIEIGKNFGIPIIEDAAEALGSKYRGQALGSFGDMGILSFNGNKIITTSGGGALISNNLSLIEKARFLASQARDPAPHYQHSQIGYNYRMSNIVAGIGRGQMEVISQRVDKCREIYKYYHENLSNYPGISFLEEPGDDYYSNRWLTTIIIDSQKSGFDREELRLKLEEHNIESRPLWKPMHLQPVFNQHPAYLSGISEQLFKTGLCLPSGTNLIEEDLNRIILVIISKYENSK